MDIVLGPPGTGKTTYLLEQMEQELDRGVPPDRIGFVSFTRRAAQEAKDRAKKKFKLADKDLPFVQTLHALCFKALGMHSSQVLEGSKLKEFGDWAGISVSGYVAMDEGATFGFQHGDRCLFMDNLARVRGIPLRQQYDEDDDGLLWNFVETTSRNLAEYKRAKHLMDYTDMLTEFIKSAWSARLEVLFVDEAQDLSFLQWQVVDHLKKGTRRVAVAGDDDQAIYRWAGAAVDHFIGLPGREVVLNHSWRVPQEVQTVALSVLAKINQRRAKPWNPRQGKGEVIRVRDLEHAALNVDEDTLILSRNSCFLREDAMLMLEGAGILYEYKGHPSIRQSLTHAIVNWEKLRKGEEVTVGEAEHIYNEMKAGEGYTRGHKKLPAWSDRDQLITLEDLKEAGGLQTEAAWYEALTRVTLKERTYMRAVLRNGQSLIEQPKMRISTIHGAKGAQADHVVILTDMAWRSHKEAERLPEDEARTWYVATTRAKQKLTIIFPQNRFRGYDI